MLVPTRKETALKLHILTYYSESQKRSMAKNDAHNLVNIGYKSVKLKGIVSRDYQEKVFP
jgi:hypothetical protein